MFFLKSGVPKTNGGDGSDLQSARRHSVHMDPPTATSAARRRGEGGAFSAGKTPSRADWK